MSCSDNYIVPGANPCATGGGVQSVGPGTSNVTITGTSTNPLINVTTLAGVTQVEGQTGNVNLNGVGMSIVGSSPSPGNVTFTANVQNVTGTGIATVTQPSVGTFQVFVPAASGTVSSITGINAATVTQPTTGNYQISVPFPSVSSITGLNAAIVTQPTFGNYQISVPFANISSITGSGAATVTNVGSAYNISVPTVPSGSVSSITGSGAAVVTNVGSAYNVDVPVALVSSITGSGSAVVTNVGSAYNVSVPSPSQTAIFTPVINAGWTAVDGDVALLDRPLLFSGSITNLATAETIVCHISCGPILGQPTSGPTNASFFSIKALVSPSGLGTPNPTPAYGQYIVDYGALTGGDFVVVLSKARGEFFADSGSISFYKMDLPAAPFSSAILNANSVPTIYINMYAM